jgi:hypothetical protein
MPAYRVYVVTGDGLIIAPATVQEGAEEQEAMGLVGELNNGKAVELWEGARLIMRFPGDNE